MRPRGGMSPRWTVPLLALICLLCVSPVQPRSFGNCKSLCNINKGRGLCLVRTNGTHKAQFPPSNIARCPARSRAPTTFTDTF